MSLREWAAVSGSPVRTDGPVRVAPPAESIHRHRLTSSPTRQVAVPTTIVTGAASGIGRGLAAAFVGRGHHVVVADIDLATATSAAAGMPGPGTASAAQVDVRDADAVQALVDATEDAHGPLDTMVNNAGIGVVGWSHELPAEQWRAVYDVNLHGVLHGVLAVYPRFMQRRAGRIVNMASLSAFTPVPAAAAYASSKHAVLGLTTSLRAEAAAHGVRVHAVCPGFVETPLLHDEAPGSDGLSFASVARALRLPATTTDRVVADVMRGLDRNTGVIVTPATARATRALTAIAPDAIGERITRRLADRLRRR